MLYRHIMTSEAASLPIFKMTPQGLATISGTRKPECLPEVLCVAVALSLVLCLLPPVPAGAAEPVEPPVELVPGHGVQTPTVPRVALAGDGGLVAVWADRASQRLLGRAFGSEAAADAESGTPFELSAPVAPAQIAVTRLAGTGPGEDDRFLAVWTGRGPVSQGGRRDLWAQPFDGEGNLLAEAVRIFEGDVRSASLEVLDLDARPDGGAVVVWLSAREDGGTGIRTRFLDDAGRPAGPESPVAEMSSSFRADSLHLAVMGSGDFVVSWDLHDLQNGRATIAARTFGPTGAAGQSGEVHLIESRQVDGPLFHDLAARPVGFWLAWGDREEGRTDPPVLVRRFSHLGQNLGPARRVDPQDEAGSPVHVSVAGVTGEAGGAVVAWTVDTGSEERISARRVGPAGEPAGERFTVLPPEQIEASGRSGVTGLDLAGGAGRVAFGWVLAFDLGTIPIGGPMEHANGVRRFELDDGTLPPADPPPPSRAPLTSPELPGFRVWAEITPRGQASIPGTRGAACLPETLCVAGALPGRAEAFVRVIGPRPNGFLWPVLVQLTPSEVEVWIEQVVTGEVRYYRLEVAEPGVDELDGLIDRTGFSLP